MNATTKAKRTSLLKLLGEDPNEESLTFDEACDMCEPAEQDAHVFCESSGKRSYTSESTARKKATNSLNRKSDTSKLRCYLCPDCNMWHLSSSFHRKNK